MVKKNYISLIAWIGVLLLVGWASGYLTDDSVNSWYLTLNRSPLTPPGYVFGIAWTILYIMIAISGWLIWQSAPFAGLGTIKGLFIAQLLLNWSWTPIFFHYQQVGLGLLCILAILVLLVPLIVKSFAKLKVASVLLMPYLAWLIFAAYLNFYIWKFN